MRLLKLPAAILAVVLSIMAESVVFLVTRLFGVVGYRHFSALQDYWYQLYLWFYMPGARLSEGLSEARFISHDVGMGLMIFVALCQWWLIFFLAIWMLRRFRRPQHEK